MFTGIGIIHTEHMVDNASLHHFRVNRDIAAFSRLGIDCVLFKGQIRFFMDRAAEDFCLCNGNIQFFKGSDRIDVTIVFRYRVIHKAGSVSLNFHRIVPISRKGYELFAISDKNLDVIGAGCDCLIYDACNHLIFVSYELVHCNVYRAADRQHLRGMHHRFPRKRAAAAHSIHRSLFCQCIGNHLIIHFISKDLLENGIRFNFQRFCRLVQDVALCCLMELESLLEQENRLHILILNQACFTLYKNIDNVGRILAHGNQFAYLRCLAGRTADQITKGQTDGNTGQHAAGNRLCRGRGQRLVNTCRGDGGAALDGDGSDPLDCLNGQTIPDFLAYHILEGAGRYLSCRFKERIINFLDFSGEIR